MSDRISVAHLTLTAPRFSTSLWSVSCFNVFLLSSVWSFLLISRPSVMALPCALAGEDPVSMWITGSALVCATPSSQIARLVFLHLCGSFFFWLPRAAQRGTKILSWINGRKDNPGDLGEIKQDPMLLSDLLRVTGIFLFCATDLVGIFWVFRYMQRLNDKVGLQDDRDGNSVPLL